MTRPHTPPLEVQKKLVTHNGQSIEKNLYVVVIDVMAAVFFAVHNILIF